MRNKFVENPSDDIIVDVERLYGIHDGIIQIGIEDLHSVISGSKNVLVIEGVGNGNNRVSNAIEDALLHTCQTAPGYDIFSADKVIIKLIYPQMKELMLNEVEALTQLAEMFPPTTQFIWGVSESEDLRTDAVALIVASNIVKIE